MKLKFWEKDSGAEANGQARTSHAGLYTAIGGTALIGAIAATGITSTGENEIRLVTKGGKAVGTLDAGYGYKIPFIQDTFNLRADVIEIKPEPPSISIQNGTITAKTINSVAYIRLNGSREQQEETARIIFAKMKDFEPRMKSLTEKAMRDVIRGSVIPTADDAVVKDAKAKSVTEPAIKGDAKPNFLDSELIGKLTGRALQANINAIIGDQINIGTAAKPEMADRIEVTNVAIQNFEWDDDYKAKRKEIQDARMANEKAGFKEQEAERMANATRKTAEGDRDAEILRGEGKATAALALKTAEADGIKLTQGAEAEGFEKRIKAVGGVDNLQKLILAQQWNGSNVTIGASSVITDTRSGATRDTVIAVPPVGPAHK